MSPHTAGLAALLAATILIHPSAGFAENSSLYSTLDFDKTCQWKAPESEEEAQMGGEAVCDGIEGYPVHFIESDLRQYVTYGQVADPVAFATGFGEWNYVNKTVEWRLEDGRPFAAIHRWFIEIGRAHV